MKLNEAKKIANITTYCVRVSYDGSNFLGWAKQTVGRTVEAEINKILSSIFNLKIEINGVSRTDARVHSCDQVFTFSLPFFLEKESLLKILRQHFNQDIKINAIKIVDNDYDVRKNVKYKEYRYYINIKNHDPFKFNYQYQFDSKISVIKMKKALKLFVGKNYFYNFSGLLAKDKKNPYRIVDKIKAFKRKNQIVVVIRARGFLRYQIRYMIAAALDYCQNKISLADISNFLSCNQTKKYPYPKAQPQGLYLCRVVLKN